MAEILYGKPVAQFIKQQVISDIDKLGHCPVIATVGFANNLEWQQYAGSIARNAQQYNCIVNNIELNSTCSEQQLSDVIDNLNNDTNTDALLLQQPLPESLMSCANKILWYKDCDSLSQSNFFATFVGREHITSATPTAVVRMLEFYNIPLKGKNVVIIGRGLAVGKPLSLMLTNRNATVTLCHTSTVDLPNIARKADIIVTACGRGAMVDKQYVSSNSIVIDVGLSFTNGKMQGDVNIESIGSVCKAYSPVPGGIGPVTQACLFANAVKCAQLRGKYDNKR